MASATGIEIAGNTLRCVVLQGSAKAPRLKTAFAASFELDAEAENSSKSPGERVGEILKQKGVPTGNVVFALDGRHVYCREVVLPFTRSDQIQKTIKFEAEDFMPAAPVESMVVDHYKVVKIDGKSRVLVAGIQKAQLTETLDLCRDADFSPRVLDLDSACLANAGFAAGVFGPPQVEKTETGEEVTLHNSVVALDVSPEVTRLVLLEDGRLRRTRTFKVSINPQSPEADAVRKIVREVKRTEASCSLAAPVSVAYLTGAAYTVNLGVMLRQTLGLDVQSLALGKIINSEDEERLRILQEAGTIALGAALKGLGVDNIAFDFRKEEFAYRKAFDELKAGLACTACLAFFMAFMLAYTFNLRLSQHHYAVDTLRDDAKKAFLTLLQGETLKAYDTPAILKAFQKSLDKRKSGRLEEAPKITSALNILRDFGEAVRRANVKFRLTDCRIDQNSVRITGVVGNALEGERIKKEIANRSKYLLIDQAGFKVVRGETVITQRYKVKESK